MSTASADATQDLRYGFIGIIVGDRAKAGARVNQILSTFADCIVARQGLPNLAEGTLSIITVIVHTTTDRMGALTGKLGALPTVSVKSALHAASVGLG